MSNKTRMEIASCSKKPFYKRLSMSNYTTVKIIDYAFAWRYIPNTIGLIFSFLIPYYFFVFTGESKISLGISIFAFFIIYIFNTNYQMAIFVIIYFNNTKRTIIRASSRING